MLIRFTEDAELEVVENYDEKNDVVDSTHETFKKDVEHDVDLLDDHGETLDFQFGDGSVAFNVPKSIIQQVCYYSFPIKDKQSSVKPGEELFYTIIDPTDDKKETRLNIIVAGEDGNTRFGFEDEGVTIGQQQLFELGCLFLALAGEDVDKASGAELVEGYGIDVSPALDRYCED